MDAILIETVTNNSRVSVAAAPPQISANVSQAAKRIPSSARQDHERTGSCRENTTLARFWADSARRLEAPSASHPDQNHGESAGT
jgi:hypothetical protein